MFFLKASIDATLPFPTLKGLIVTPGFREHFPVVNSGRNHCQSSRVIFLDEKFAKLTRLVINWGLLFVTKFNCKTLKYHLMFELTKYLYCIKVRIGWGLVGLKKIFLTHLLVYSKLKLAIRYLVSTKSVIIFIFRLLN